MGHHDSVHYSTHLIPARKVSVLVHVCGLAEVEVQVAVAHMAERHGSDARDQLCHGSQGLLDEAWDVRHRYRDIVLDAAALALLRLRNRLAQLPQCRCLGRAAGQSRVGNQAVVQCLSHECLGRGACNRQVDQHVPRRSGCQRIQRARHVLEHQVEGEARDHLESQHAAVTRYLARQSQKIEHRLGSRHRRKRGFHLAVAREQLQHRGGDDSQGSLGADVELLEIVAGVVFAQPAQAIPDFALGGDDFQPQHQVTRVSVAQDMDAPRIGREIAPDLTTALGCQAEREEPVRLGCGLLNRRQQAARLGGQGVVDRIHEPHAVHA